MTKKISRISKEDVLRIALDLKMNVSNEQAEEIAISYPEAESDAPVGYLWSDIIEDMLYSRGFAVARKAEKTTTIPLRKYKSNEIVGAAEISDILVKDGNVVISSTDEDFGNFSVTMATMDLLQFKVGGMFIIKENEAMMYLSKEEFEKNYTLII